jgi:spermidine synthase
MTPLVAVACVSATLLMTELALTRIFSVIMYYHFAFLAISIALFGLSASGVYAYLRRTALDRRPTASLLATRALVYAAATVVSAFVLVRLRVGLSYSPENLRLMLAIYAVAALPFFTGGLVITLAISRLSRRVNAVYAADLTGAAAGCLALIPLLNVLGAPGVVITAAALACVAAVLFAPAPERRQVALLGVLLVACPIAGQLSGLATFDVTDTKGHRGDRILFSKWNSFSRIGVYEREHGDWSLSGEYKGPLPESRFMDIDSAASTPILRLAPDWSNVQYLRYELTALPYQLQAPGFRGLVIGPGGGRDLVSALVFGASRVDGVEINPIIATDVMREQFRDYSGGIYTDPRVRIFVEDGRSYVRRTPERYDVIQASLVDTWAATAAGAYTLTENTLYTVEAFDDYLDHLTDEGMLSITRWVFDGLRLVSLAQEACARRGWDAAPRLAIVQHDRVATFLLKRSPFSAAEIDTLRATADRLKFRVLYAPPVNGVAHEAVPDLPDDTAVEGTEVADYGRLIRAADRESFYRAYRRDIRPTTDDRPFFFHTTKLADQFEVAFGRTMLFGNGLSALMTLMGISVGCVGLFVLMPLALSNGARVRGWLPWLVYFSALGAGFMLIEVSLLQRFVLLLGHPVYSLTVTLFSLLLGTGLGSAFSRGIEDRFTVRTALAAIALIVVMGIAASAVLDPVINWAIPLARPLRLGIAAALLLPVGVVLGVPMPAGLRLLRERAPEMLTWAWGMNGALSVLGATLGIFIAMNWGFRTTLVCASMTYAIAFVSLSAAAARR